MSSKDGGNNRKRSSGGKDSQVKKPKIPHWDQG